MEIKITAGDKEYYLASAAAKRLFVSRNTLRRHMMRGLPHIRMGAHSWVNLDDANAYFKSLRQKQDEPMRYKRNSVEIDGRIYHSYAWYCRTYKVSHGRLRRLPYIMFGAHVKLVAEEDFESEFGKGVLLR